MFLALNFLLLFLAATQDSSGAIPIKTALDELCETLGRSYHVTPEQCISALCYDPSLPCTLSSFVSTHNSTVEDEEIAAAMAVPWCSGGSECDIFLSQMVVKAWLNPQAYTKM
ncbi:hypothetical protein EJB05_05930, partial [Eragrostis curvula]